MIWNLIKLNLLFCLFALPSGVLFALALFTPLGGLGYALSVAAAFPVGGACTACFFCLSKIVRRDPGYLWYDFKRKLKENFRQAAAPGILCVAFLYLEIFLWQYFLFAEPNIFWVVAAAVPLIAFLMVVPYIFLQIAYIELKTFQILKNSLLIAFGNAGRSFAGAFLGGLIWIVFILLLPDSLPYSPLLLVFGFSVPWLLNLLLIWPPVDKQFSINKTLRGENL